MINRESMINYYNNNNNNDKIIIIIIIIFVLGLQLGCPHWADKCPSPGEEWEGWNQIGTQPYHHLQYHLLYYHHLSYDHLLYHHLQCTHLLPHRRAKAQERKESRDFFS